jgi:hypothetical protein
MCWITLGNFFTEIRMPQDPQQSGNRAKVATLGSGSPDQLRALLGIKPNLRDTIPAIQYPLSAEPGQIHSIGLLFPEALDPSTVSADTVMLKLDGEHGTLDGVLEVVDGKALRFTPKNRISDKGGLVHIMVTPDIKMADGRPFAGFFVSVPSA